MPDYAYLIVGGGMTADAAVKGITQLQAEASIGIISNESHLPYNRPKLTKGLWKGEPLESVELHEAQKKNVEVHLSRTAHTLDLDRHTVTDDQGVTYSFGKLLLATGGRVKQLPFDAEGIIYFRTLDDYLKLRSQCGEGRSFVVIGAGFNGAEIAAALAMNHASVTMLFPGAGIGSAKYPPRLSYFLNTYYRSKGIELIAHETPARIEKTGDRYRVTTSGGRTIEVDGVVASIGIEPNTELAQAAGLEVNNGIVVDDYLCTSHPLVYAAGDVANFYHSALGKRMRVEHEDNAKVMGECAGNNMTGVGIAYKHVPYFYSDLFDLGYEAVGELDVTAEIIEDWNEEFKEGVIYYVKQKRVQGVLLWNRWGLVDEARRLIAEKGPIEGKSLRGRL